MILHYKKETPLVKYFKEQKETTAFQEGGWLVKLGFSSLVYPDVYFHTGYLNAFSKKIIENSKLTIINSNILKTELLDMLNVSEDKLQVVLPSVETVKFKKKDAKKDFYTKHNIDKDKKIVYFTANNVLKSGLDSFCDIMTKLETENYEIVVSVKIDKEIDLAKERIKSYRLDEKIILIKEDIFDIADIFVLPTTNKNMASSVIKAMANKCAVFVPQNNYVVELIDVFAIMDTPSDSNTAYKIDMLLRVSSELKKIQKENYSIAKELSFENQKKVLDEIINKIS